MTMHTPDPLPAAAEGTTETPCYICEEPAIGCVETLPVCREHCPDPCVVCGRLCLVGMYPVCGRRGPSGHGWMRADPAQRFDPIVVHWNPATQSYRFPGSADAQMPSGFVKKELRNFSEVRRFQRHWNTLERARVDRVVSRDIARIDALDAKNRPELRQAMQHMDPYMRDFAELSMRMNDMKRPKMFEPNCHIEAMEFDSSNREEHRDARTGWRGRK